jgi:hypothetical protein
VGFAGHTSARRPGAGRTVCVGVGSGGGATEIDRFISLLTCSSLHLRSPSAVPPSLVFAVLAPELRSEKGCYTLNDEERDRNRNVLAR